VNFRNRRFRTTFHRASESSSSSPDTPTLSVLRTGKSSGNEILAVNECFSLSAFYTRKSFKNNILARGKLPLWKYLWRTKINRQEKRCWIFWQKKNSKKWITCGCWTAFPQKQKWCLSSKPSTQTSTRKKGNSRRDSNFVNFETRNITQLRTTFRSSLNDWAPEPFCVLYRKILSSGTCKPRHVFYVWVFLPICTWNVLKTISSVAHKKHFLCEEKNESAEKKSHYQHLAKKLFEKFTWGWIRTRNLSEKRELRANR